MSLVIKKPTNGELILKKDYFPIPSLDLRFAETKSLRDYITDKNLVDHTRASSGTYVGSDGLIKTATTNLLQQSEDFSTTWISQLSSVTSDATTAPNGTVTADKIVASGGSGEHNVYQSFTVVSGQTYTFSCYLKPAERTLFSLAFRVASLWPSSSNQAIDFNLSNGTFAITSGSPTGTIASVGNGWYRCSITSTAITSGTGQVRVQDVFDADGEGVFVWGAQLEQSDTVSEYVKTTSTINSAPRFDHDPTTGESLGLLVEEQRANLITDSSLTTVGILIAAVILSTTETNPEGINFCQRILSDAGSAAGGHRIRVNANSANSITVSAFVKKDTHRYVYIGFGGASNSFTALFDIDPTVTGDRLLGQGGQGTYTNIDAGYQNFPNGWVRIWAAGTTTGTDGTTIGFSPDDSTYEITNWNAAGTEAIFIHGVQYEDNATFPTSYIPTEGSTVTRAADVCSISGSNFSSWYQQDEGTVFVNVFNRAIYSGTNSFPYIAQFDDGTNAERISLDHSVLSGGYRTQYVVRDDDVNQASITAQVGLATSAAKWSAAYGLNSFASASNGAVAVTDSSGTVPTVNRLQIGTGFGAQYNGTLKRLTYWNQRLSDSTLVNLTNGTQPF